MRSDKYRVEFLNELLSKINEVKNWRSIYVYGHMPILYFLTDSRPFIEQIWLRDNTTSAENIYIELVNESSICPLPIIVVTEPKIFGDNGWRTFSRFLDQNHYEVYSFGQFSHFQYQLWVSTNKTWIPDNTICPQSSKILVR